MLLLCYCTKQVGKVSPQKSPAPKATEVPPPKATEEEKPQPERPKAAAHRSVIKTFYNKNPKQKIRQYIPLSFCVI